MANFRTSLKQKIVSRTERLGKRLTRIPDVSASEKKRLADRLSRDSTLVRPKQMLRQANVRRRARMASEFIARMVKAFRSFIRQRGTATAKSLKLTASRFRSALNNLIERTRERIVGLARRVIDREITPAAFRDSLTRTIRRLHVSSLWLGIRGGENMTGNIAELFIAQVSRQLNLAENFSNFIQNIIDAGEQLSADMSNRVSRAITSVANAARSTFSQSESQLVDDIYNERSEDVVEEQRVLDPGSKHCDPCVEWSGFWGPIGTIPAINTLICGDNCRCTKIYRVLRDGQPVTEFSD